MGSDISLDLIFDGILVKESIEDFNNVNWVLEMVHQGEENLDSSSFVFQNTIKVCQAVVEKLIITGDIFDNFNKTTNGVNGLFLVLHENWTSQKKWGVKVFTYAWFVKKISLLLIISQKEFSQDLSGTLGDESTA